LTLISYSSTAPHSSLALPLHRSPSPSPLPLVALSVATAVSNLANFYTPLYRTIQPLCNLSLFSLCTMIIAFISLFLDSILCLVNIPSLLQYSKKNVCFIMFLDEQTLLKLSTEGNVPDERVCIGLWRIVIVRNLPYKDMRKTGKVPKFLSHHLFSSSRYSIWLDSKM
ncbi:hypothetical protein HYC85_013462, partial [Camellia sinensis]